MIVVDLRPSSPAQPAAAQTGLWNKLQNPGICALLPTRKNDDPSSWRDDVLEMAKRASQPLIALVIVAGADCEADQVRDWAQWGRNQGVALVTAVNPPRLALSEDAGVLIDFVCEAAAPGDLLHVPRTILESRESIVSYDFADLANMWRGRCGTVRQMPCDKIALQHFRAEWQNAHPGCQSASKRDPLSACKRGPPCGFALGLITGTDFALGLA